MAVTKLNIPTIIPKNGKASTLLKKVFVEVARGKSAHESYTPLEAVKSDVLLTNVSYSGTSIEFAYNSQAIPKGEVRPIETDSLFFLNTNEIHCVEFKESISCLTGITHYVGVSGGLDGPLAQLSYLSSNNAISEAKMVDYAGSQVIYGMLKLFEYDLKPYEKLIGIPEFGALTLAGKLPHKIKFDLIVADIKNVVEELHEPGKYFIYLSNVYFMPISNGSADRDPSLQLSAQSFVGHSTVNHTSHILRSVLANQNITNGSAILFADANSDMYIILQKKDDTLVVGDYGPKHESVRGFVTDFSRGTVELESHQVHSQFVSFQIEGQNRLIHGLILNPNLFSDPIIANAKFV